MKLERYNQILWAVVGSLALLGSFVLAFFLLIQRSNENKPPIIVLGKPNQPKPNQDLIFCEPMVIRGANRQLFPVAVINVDDPTSNKTVFPQAWHSMYQAEYSYSPSRCGLEEYGGSSRIVNVIVKDTKTNRQWLLLNRPAQISSLNIPSEKCKSGEGQVPCGIIQWLIRDRDTNKDGMIDNKDALVAFISDTQTAKFAPVTPQDASMIGFVWDPDRNALLYQVRVDSNHNGEFDRGDATNILEYVVGKSDVAQPVVDEGLRKELLSKIR